MRLNKKTGSLRCPYCHGEATGQLAGCPCCGTEHHADCLRAFGCTTLGCHRPVASVPQEARSVHVPHDFRDRLSIGGAYMVSAAISFGLFFFGPLVIGLLCGTGFPLHLPISDDAWSLAWLLWFVGFMVLLMIRSDGQRREGELTFWQEFGEDYMRWRGRRK